MLFTNESIISLNPHHCKSIQCFKKHTNHTQSCFSFGIERTPAAYTIAIRPSKLK